MKSFLFIFLPLVLCSACISGKKYREEREIRRDFEERYLQYEGETERLGRYVTELETKLSRLELAYTESEAQRLDLKTRAAEMDARLAAYDSQSTATQQEQARRDRELAALEAELKEDVARVDELKGVVTERDILLSGVVSSLDLMLEGAKPENFEMIFDKRGVVITLLDETMFRSGQTRVRTDGQGLLGIVAQALRDNSKTNARIIVHTDNRPPRGNIKDNWALSALRGTSVVRYFTGEEELPPGRFRVIAAGDSQPRYDNEDELGRKLNRRTEIVITAHETAIEELLNLRGR